MLLPRTILLGIAAAGLVPGLLSARPPKRELAPSVSLDALKACRSEQDAGRRLACFDASVAKLLDAEARRDVVVVDREQVREARRSLFGLSLPDFKLFGGGEDGDPKERVDRIEATLARADRDPYGNWVFVLAEGARWHQIDGYQLAREPRRGDKVVVTRAALGSFKLSVAGSSAVRVRREN